MAELDNNGLNGEELKSEEKFGNFDQFGDADDAFMFGDDDDSADSGLDSFSFDSDSYSFNEKPATKQEAEPAVSDVTDNSIDNEIGKTQENEIGKADESSAFSNEGNEVSDDVFDNAFAGGDAQQEVAEEAAPAEAMDAESKARQELIELINKSQKAEKATPAEEEEPVERKSFSDIDADETEEIVLDDIFPEHPSVIDIENATIPEDKAEESIPESPTEEKAPVEPKAEEEKEEKKKFPLLLIGSIIAGIVLLAGALWFADSKLHFISSAPKDKIKHKPKHRTEIVDSRVRDTIKANEIDKAKEDSIIAAQIRLQDSIDAKLAEREAKLATKAKEDSLRAVKEQNAKSSRELYFKHKKEEAERKAKNAKIEAELAAKAKAQKDKELRAERDRIRSEKEKQAAFEKAEAKAKREAERAKLAEAKRQKQEAEKVKREIAKQAKLEADRAKREAEKAKREAEKAKREADKAKLAKAKTEAPKAKTEAKSKVSSKDEEYTVQVYASPSREDAVNWLNKIRKKVGNQAVMTDHYVRNVKWYRIRFGSFKSREEAESAARNSGFNQAWIDRVK